MVPSDPGWLGLWEGTISVERPALADDWHLERTHGDWSAVGRVDRRRMTRQPILYLQPPIINRPDPLASP